MSPKASPILKVALMAAQHTNGADQANDSKLSAKFGKSDWRITEQKLDPKALSVLTALVAYGEHDTLNINTIYKCYGDPLYIEIIRPLLQNFELRPGDKIGLIQDKNRISLPPITPPKKKIHVKKAEQISIENTKKTAKDTVLKILATFKSPDAKNKFEQSTSAYNSPIVEIKGIGLMHSAHLILSDLHTFKVDKFYSFVLDIIVALQKFVHKTKNYVGQSVISSKTSQQVSSTLITDVEVKLNLLLVHFPCSGKSIQDYAPHLIYQTTCDNAIPSEGIKLRAHQMELIDKVFESPTGSETIYNPVIGVGKTTTLAGLGARVRYLRTANPATYNTLQILAVCNIEPVRLQFSNICYNAKISYSSASRNYDTGGYKITRSWSCIEGESEIVIICGPEIAYEIIRDYTKLQRDNTVLFIDEPTVGADNLYSSSLRSNMCLSTVP